MTDPGQLNLTSTFIRLTPNASAELLPVDADFWPRLSAGVLGDFHNEYLVSCYTFDSDWTSWEMHPAGDEVVCLLAGEVTFVLEQGSGQVEHALRSAGEFLLVPKGTWHTAKVRARAHMLFITAGENTQHRDIKL